jgi:DNA-binding NtrC family response regulator
MSIGQDGDRPSEPAECREAALDAGANILGKSPAILDALKRIRRIASTDATVLIEGETGTGKELAARAIHYFGTRRAFPFLPVNCGALPDGLAENELFGHERGAFTDAHTVSPGVLRLAHRGTLFLDEIDSLPLRVQSVLLRFLEDKRFRPLGARNEEHADVRIIAASNAPLERLVTERTFRADLYYRLRMMSITLPPLRERIGDAELLAGHFLRECARQYRQPEKSLHPFALEWMRSHRWPGNVRELENLIHREFLLSESSCISMGATPPPDVITRAEDSGEGSAGMPFVPYALARNNAIEQFDRRYLTMLLSRTHGNVTRAALLAGKERRALGKLIKHYRIIPSRFASTEISRR